jgi:hypothetical protein
LLDNRLRLLGEIGNLHGLGVFVHGLGLDQVHVGTTSVPLGRSRLLEA